MKLFYLQLRVWSEVSFFDQRTPDRSVAAGGQMGKGGIQPLPMFTDAVPVVGIELGLVSHDIDVIALFFDDSDVKFRNDVFQRNRVENQFKRDAFQLRYIRVGE